MRTLIRAALVAAMLLPCVSQAAAWKYEAAGTIANAATYTGKGWSNVASVGTTYAVAQFTTTATAGTFSIFVDTSADGATWVTQGGGTTGKTIGTSGTYIISFALPNNSTWPAPYARIRATNSLTTQTATTVTLGFLVN